MSVSVSQSIPELTPQYVIDLVTRLNRLARVNRNFAWGCEIIVYHLDNLLNEVLREIGKAESWPEVDEENIDFTQPWWVGFVPEDSSWRPALDLVSRVLREQEQLRLATRPRGRKARQ